LSGTPVNYAGTTLSCTGLCQGRGEASLYTLDSSPERIKFAELGGEKEDMRTKP